MYTEDEIMVSICCITYNHEKYIADALEGFLMQETDFKFEILIHDDASTDRTAEIIRSYEQKYPEIIKPIYQTENQYSKGIKPSTLLYKQSKSKYIALCEGDDYWIDPLKLQKQVDYMEQNPSCTFCFHNAFLANGNKGLIKKDMVPYSNENRRFYFNENKKYTAGKLQLLGFIPTASFLFPKKVVDKLPNWYFNAPAGDNALKLIASSYGYAYYINEKMSVYRINVSNSITAVWKNEDIDTKINRHNCFLNMVENFNMWSEYKYADDLDVSKKYYEFRIEVAKKNIQILFNPGHKEFFYRLSLKEKLGFILSLIN